MRSPNKNTVKRIVKETISNGLPKLLFCFIFDRAVAVIAKDRQSKHIGLLATLFIYLIALLPGLLIGLLFNEIREFKELGAYTTLVMALSVVSMATARKYGIEIFSSIRDTVVDYISKPSDLVILNRWLSFFFYPKKSILLSMLFGILTGSAAIWIVSGGYGHFVGYGLSFLALVSGAIFGIGFNYAFFIVFLPLLLSRFDFDLFDLDPSSSYVLKQLDRILTKYLYVVSVLLGFFTFILSFYPETNGFNTIVLIIGWLPIAVQFIANHVSLSRIIRTAKDKTHKKLERKISSFAVKSLTHRDLESIASLNAMHVSVSRSPNSMLNFAGAMTLMNQLFIPLIGVILTGLNR